MDNYQLIVYRNGRLVIWNDTYQPDNQISFFVVCGKFEILTKLITKTSYKNYNNDYDWFEHLMNIDSYPDFIDELMIYRRRIKKLLEEMEDEKR